MELISLLTGTLRPYSSLLTWKDLGPLGRCLNGICPWYWTILTKLLLNHWRKSKPSGPDPENCLFLITLATAGRVSEVHALTDIFSHTDGWGSVHLSYDPLFLAKTVKAGIPSTYYGPVEVKALSILFPPEEREDIAQCPVSCKGTATIFKGCKVFER